MHTPWGGGQPIPNTPFRRVISNDATDNRLVMLAVDLPVGENVAPHIHGHANQRATISRASTRKVDTPELRSRRPADLCPIGAQ